MKIIDMSPLEAFLGHQAASGAMKDGDHPLWKMLLGGETQSSTTKGSSAGKGNRTGPNTGDRMRNQMADAEDFGRYGDTELVHVNPREEHMLKAQGGAGTVNPRTGLKEYYEGTDFSGRSDTGSAASNNAASGGGIGGGRDSKSDAGSGQSSRADSPEVSGDSPLKGVNEGKKNPGGGSGSDTQARLAGSTPMQQAGNATTADYLRAAAMGLTPDGLNKVATNLRDATTDYNDSENSTMDDIGNWIARSLGFNEQDPARKDYKDLAQPGADRADWSWDPAGAIGSMAASAAGMPFGGGLIADLVSSALDRPLAITIGPDVTGALTSSNPEQSNAALGIVDAAKLGQADALTAKSWSERVFGGGTSHVTESGQPIGGGASAQSTSSAGGNGDAGGQGNFAGRGRDSQNAGVQGATVKPTKSTAVTAPVTGTTPPPAGGTTTPPTGVFAAGLPQPGSDDHNWTKQFKKFQAANDLEGYKAYLTTKGLMPAAPATPAPGTPGTPGGPVVGGDPGAIGDIIKQLVFPYFPPLAKATIDMAPHNDMLHQALLAREVA